MPIFRTIGFGLFIIILKLMLPDVLEAGRHSVIAVLRGIGVTADSVSSIATHASTTSSSSPSTLLASPSPLFLPRTPSITTY